MKKLLVLGVLFLIPLVSSSHPDGHDHYLFFNFTQDQWVTFGGVSQNSFNLNTSENISVSVWFNLQFHEGSVKSDYMEYGLGEVEGFDNTGS